ncbi:MAG: hypothetical protein QF654_07440 [Alphaproteobacteria bacterium]|nr:hypothetical protein [Alphaproteobacteria bacterium]
MRTGRIPLAIWCGAIAAFLAGCEAVKPTDETSPVESRTVAGQHRDLTGCLIRAMRLRYTNWDYIAHYPNGENLALVRASFRPARSGGAGAHRWQLALKQVSDHDVSAKVLTAATVWDHRPSPDDILTAVAVCSEGGSATR